MSDPRQTLHDAGGLFPPAILVTRRAKCFLCDKDVLWMDIDGLLRPIDPEPVPWGDIELIDQWNAVVCEPEVSPRNVRYQPHEDMCEGLHPVE